MPRWSSPAAAAVILAGIFLAGALLGADLVRVGEGEALAGGGLVAVPITATNDLAIQGFSLSVWFDPRDLEPVDVTYAGTTVEPLLPEYFNRRVDGSLGNVALAVIFEVSSPYDLVSLPPSPVARPIAVVTFDVLPEATPEGSALRLADGPGEHPIKNVFTHMGSSLFPALEDGAIRILPRPFRRGFVNADDRIDISDAITLFSYLFLGGQAPPCLPAANLNGDRRVDLSDGIWLLSWIFRGGPPPLEPFRECGDDPRPLLLPCTGPAACP